MKDPYTYEDGTLRNKLNIRDHQELRQAEARPRTVAAEPLSDFQGI